ncbi:MAG: hypothetical protein IJ193_01005 [Bacilli bacterium]|nr:hypothetical protein [Bacilli bacterium]
MSSSIVSVSVPGVEIACCKADSASANCFSYSSQLIAPSVAVITLLLSGSVLYPEYSLICCSITGNILCDSL